MQDFSKIQYIDTNDIRDKRVLLRVDFDVALDDAGNVMEETRICEALPTLNLLLEKNNKVILLAHLDRPGGEYKPEFSLQPVASKLKELMPDKEIVFIKSLFEYDFSRQQSHQIYLLENIRFYKEEEIMDIESMLAKKLSEIADIFVYDAFAVAHRAHLSTVGMIKLLPPFGGLRLKKEVSEISKFIKASQNPVTAVIGGAKISTKIGLIKKLMDKVDFVLIGGGLANTFLAAQGIETGRSLCERESISAAQEILALAKQGNCQLVLPLDVVLGEIDTSINSYIKSITELTSHDNKILDIGPHTQAVFGNILTNSKTIIWNGPMGLFEKSGYERATDYIYYTILQNNNAFRLLGGGDTLAAISNKPGTNQIEHISTGGGAMLEFIEKETLPVLEALNNN